MTLNKMMIIGNLGADPELRYTPSGKAVTNLRVAVNDRSRGADGEWIEETMWIGVEVWEQQAERLAEQLRKGNKIYAEGQLRAREYEARDGQKRTALELRFARVVNLERRNREEGSFAGSEGGVLRRRAAAGEAARRRDHLVGTRRRDGRRRHSLLATTDREEPIPTWQAHDPAASRRTTTAIGVDARSATSASTRPRASTTRRSTASAAT